MKVVIIGGGAAGLLAAAKARDNGNSVTVIERNPRVARKVMITGKGRCNLTNACDFNEFLDNVPRNPKFMFSALRSFGVQDIMDYVEAQGVPLKIERGNRVFPCSDRAVDVVDALYRACKGCRFLFGKRATELAVEDGRVVGVRLDSGEYIAADSVIVATGGMSYSATGSDGDGYRFARNVGHNVTPLRPSLIPLEIEEGFCKDLMGLSLRNVTLRLVKGGKVIFEDFGEMLFTHFGISGPIVLSASAHIDDTDGVSVELDLKPALTFEQLDARVLRDFEKYSNRELQNALDELLPKRMINIIISAAKLDPTIRVNQMSKSMRTALITSIKQFTMSVKGFRPIDEAIITRGGVSVREIDPKTMESKLCKGLYFAGEVLDVDGYTGGFNLQIAFSTGAAAGNAQSFKEI